MTLLDFIHTLNKTFALAWQVLRTMKCKASHQHEELRAYDSTKGRHVHCAACGHTSHGDAYCTLVKGASVR